MPGYYYLHVNGELIWKSQHTEPRDFEESDLVQKWWPVKDRTDPAEMDTILRQADNLNASPRSMIAALNIAGLIGEHD